MTIKDRLSQDLQTAMRQGNELRRSVVRLVKSSVQYEEIARGRPLDDPGVIDVINRMVRQHRESIEAFRKGNRPELVQREEGELAVLMEYLPQQLSEAELVELARQAVQETGARLPSDQGKVMGRLMPKVRGRAEGAQVSAIVARLLKEQASS
ncbi:MAG: GatB/YqeY domain-containing protein [Chloroflexi bacterium]|nr:GatB/YqeY domain-containing protein [Chloroflexota bacterium]